MSNVIDFVRRLNEKRLRQRWWRAFANPFSTEATALWIEWETFLDNQESAPGGPSEPVDPARIATLEELLLDHETGRVGDGLRGVQGTGVPA